MSRNGPSPQYAFYTQHENLSPESVVALKYFATLNPKTSNTGMLCFESIFPETCNADIHLFLEQGSWNIKFIARESDETGIILTVESPIDGKALFLYIHFSQSQTKDSMKTIVDASVLNIAGNLYQTGVSGLESSTVILPDVQSFEIHSIEKNAAVQVLSNHINCVTSILVNTRNPTK